MKIYLDTNFKCHASPIEGGREITTDAFDGKTTEYIESYRFIPAGETWTREDGAVFTGEMMSPWRPLPAEQPAPMVMTAPAPMFAPAPALRHYTDTPSDNICMEISVEGKNATITKRDKITAGQRGLAIKFTFSPEWEGLSKTAQFYNELSTVNVIITNNIAVIPAEIAVANEEVFLTVIGKDSDGIKIPTISVSFGRTLFGEHGGAVSPVPPTPKWSDQIEAAVNIAVNTANAVKQQADNGEFDGKGFQILGFYDSLTALQAAVPAPEPGDAYGVGTAAPYDIYIWDSANNVWKNDGALEGPPGQDGAPGEQGPPGPSGDNNLLDNWYFKNPVNQRGKTSIAAGSFGPDRWKLSDGSGTLSDIGYALNSGAMLGQKIDNGIYSTLAGKAITASALFIHEGTVKLATGTATVVLGQSTTFTLLDVDKIAMYILNSDNSFYVKPSGKATIVALKIEIGSTQTLAHRVGNTWVLNALPDFSTELAKCQRYLQKLSAGAYICGSFSTAGDKLYLTIPSSTEFRANPAIITNGTTLGLDTIVGRKLIENISQSTISTFNKSSGSVTIAVSCNLSDVAATPCLAWTTADIWLSAEE